MMTRNISRSLPMLALLLALAAVAMAQEPMNLAEKTVLFADDYVIEKMDGVTLEPVKHTQPFRVEKPAPPLANSTVLYDDKAKVFRVYGGQWELLPFFESKDGLNWPAPGLGLDGAPGVVPFIDTNPKAKNDQRYKGLDATKGGLYAAASPDGVKWKTLADKPVIASRFVALGCVHRAFWAADEGQYVAYVGEVRDGLRTISRATSKDFLTWTVPEPLNINLPGENLLPGWFDYNPDRIPRVIGYAVRVGKAGKGGDIVLISSHDGKKFQRTFRDAVIRPGTNEAARKDPTYVTPGVLFNVQKPRKYTFMSAMAVYAGSDRVFVVPSNRFASLHAGAEEGEVILKTMICTGNHLRLNFSTSADGYIKVEFQTPEGAPIAPYTLANAKRKTDDRPHVAEWKTKTPTRFNDMKGKTVRIRIVMKEADLYSMQFSNRD